MKIITFDGDFAERDVAWLQDFESDSEEWEKWIKRNGFCRFSGWSSAYEPGVSDVLSIETYSHTKRDAYFAEISDASRSFTVLIEGTVNYLRFLASPMCQNMGLRHDVAALRGIAERAFRAWHKHEAPYHMFDHEEARACSVCDPEFEDYRRRKRREAAERRRAAEQAKRDEAANDGGK